MSERKKKNIMNRRLSSFSGLTDKIYWSLQLVFILIFFLIFILEVYFLGQEKKTNFENFADQAKSLVHTVLGHQIEHLQTLLEILAENKVFNVSPTSRNLIPVHREILENHLSLFKREILFSGFLHQGKILVHNGGPPPELSFLQFKEMRVGRLEHQGQIIILGVLPLIKSEVTFYLGIKDNSFQSLAKMVLSPLSVFLERTQTFLEAENYFSTKKRRGDEDIIIADKEYRTHPIPIIDLHGSKIAEVILYQSVSKLGPSRSLLAMIFLLTFLLASGIIYIVVRLGLSQFVSEIEGNHKMLSQERDVFIEGPVVLFRWRNDPGWPVEYVSSNVNQVLGYSKEDFEKGRIAYGGLLHEDDSFRVTSEVQVALEREVKHFQHSPYRLRKADQSLGWFDDYSSIVRNDKGEVTHFMGYIYDTTHSRRAESELQEKNLYIRSVIDSLHDIIVVTGENGLLDANVSFFDFFDDVKTVDEFKGKYRCLCDRFIEKNHPEFVVDGKNGFSWGDFLAQAKDFQPKCAMMKDGKEFTFSIGFRRFGMGPERLSVVSLTDISELEVYRKDLETKVESAIRENREKEQLLIQQSRLAELGEMIANIAHQWRQPLNIFSLLLDDLEDLYDSDKLTFEEFEHIRRKMGSTLQNLSHTIDDFRDFFRPNKVKEDFLPSSIVERVLHLLSPILESKSIKVKISLKNQMTCYAYPNEYLHVLMNIINNAKDVLLEKSEERVIEIEIDEKEGRSLVSIKDNGGGIPEDIMHRIFEPYFTTKHKSNGTGLGLYMSKMIVEKNMKGQLLVQNEKDGAKFSIII